MIDVHAHPQFVAFRELLLKWNAKTNLTAITEIKEIEEKHFSDSLSLLPFLLPPCRLLDLGTGGGFPGIPLKIALPELEVVLLEARQKKVSFLQAAIAELGLSKIQAYAGRAEDSQVQEKLGLFDVVISRATWELKDFLSVAAVYLKKDGKIIAMKGPRWEEELKLAQKTLVGLGLECQKIHHYQVSAGVQHSLLFFSPKK